ncbi:GMC family oxidoreductase N-terminal domain-containing protein [Zhongshania arctica]|uniref:GMC family oxidoreductase N-terminal domain-containing protein n=1 Tax=Zhongshania arctica TaxID=3238302 RepID=A0ABV3U0J6_9GAMM
MLNIIQAKDIKDRKIVLDADAVVIGSGAGGAVMAYKLAKAGMSVVILEAGPYVPSSEFNEELPDMMELLYEDGGAQTNKDGDLGVLQGRCVGGSTVVNGCVTFRTPDFVLEQWQQEFGLNNLTMEALRPYYEEVEKNLSVHENQDYEINANSRIQIRGCDKLGISWKRLHRNTRACAMTGHCLAGCKTDRKQSMLVTYIPWALELGASLYADTKVTKIHTEAGVAKGVSARTSDASGAVVADIKVNAAIVVCAAGAIQTPLLFLESGIANSSAQVGKNFACHPSSAVVAEFEEDIHPWRGALLGSYVDEYMHPDKGGFILEGGGSGPIEMALSTEPGTGAAHLDFMSKIKNYATMVTLIHDHNVGHIRLNAGKKEINYAIADIDFPTMKKALSAAAKIFFAAGAKRVYLPTVSRTVLESESDLGPALDKLENEVHTLRMVSYHPQGTMRMGADKSAAVVSPNGETHDIKNLYVADASLFPSSIIVNPQITVYALSAYIADGITHDRATTLA